MPRLSISFSTSSGSTMRGGIADLGSTPASEKTGTPFSLRSTLPPFADASRSRRSMKSCGYQCACVSMICMERDDTMAVLLCWPAPYPPEVHVMKYRKNEAKEYAKQVLK